MWRKRTQGGGGGEGARRGGSRTRKKRRVDQEGVGCGPGVTTERQAGGSCITEEIVDVPRHAGAGGRLSHVVIWYSC